MDGQNSSHFRETDCDHRLDEVTAALPPGPRGHCVELTDQDDYACFVSVEIKKVDTTKAQLN